MKTWIMTLLLACIWLIPNVEALTRIVDINGTGQYISIQSAVNAAADQDTILVYPGVYYENVEIVGRYLTIGSLELITSDSTYIAQTIIDGHHNGSCISVSNESEITLRGLYLTNGIGTCSLVWGDRLGGGIYSIYSNLSIINCMIIGNKAFSAAGVSLGYSSCYLAGTIITENWGKSHGGFAFGGYSSDVVRTLVFDQENRCSIYNNYGSHANDIFIASQHMGNIDIYLDRFTVPASSAFLKECIHTEHYDYGQEFNYTLHMNTAVLDQQFADIYVSPDGDDSNSGLSITEPIKTIALAIHKIGADSQNPHTIHLANGHYAEDQHFPLNLRSYVNIVGESEEGVIFGGPDIFFMGWDSEKEVTIKNITFSATTNQEFYQTALIDCITRNKIGGIPDKFSLSLENLSFRGIRPVHYDNPLKLGEIHYPEKLILRNITVEDCMVTTGFHLWGGNVFAENVSINNLHAAPHGVITGRALTIYTNNPLYTGGDSVFHNLRITDCESRSEAGSPSGLVAITHSFLPTQFRTYFVNCTIADNHWSTGYGGAINVGEDAKATFINSIISNEAGMNFLLYNESLPSHLQFLNCLVGPADNPEDSIFNLGPNNTIEWFGTNLSSDPGFYAWTEDNPYSLGQNSPCIDSGITDFSIFNLPDWYEFPSHDLAGNPRIYGNQVDLGAYEWQGQTGIDDLVAVPAFSICNYPNPFTVFTNLKVILPSNRCNDKTRVTNASIDIYNIKGQRVKSIALDPGKAGEQFSYWDGRDEAGRQCSSGVYILNLKVNGIGALSKKVTLVR